MNIVLQEATAGLSEISLSAEGEYLKYSYLRDAVTTILTPTDVTREVVIDLNTIPYYLQIATGLLDQDGNIQHHAIQAFTKTPVSFS